MATFNGGRMVALFACVLFALNVSFAQDGGQTVILYMEDPIPVDNQLAPKAREYLDRLNDPFTWETEQDFQDARDAQEEWTRDRNDDRVKAARRYLEDEGGMSSWYPSWIPLGFAKTTEDSLFKNALYFPGGRPYVSGKRQNLREFFELDGQEPYGAEFRTCDDTKPRCRKEFYERFRKLVETYDVSLVSPDPISPSLLFPALIWPSLPPSLPPSLLLPDASQTLPSEIISPIAAPRIISFRVEVAESGTSITDSLGFVDELNQEGSVEQSTTTQLGKIELLQEAIIDPNDDLSFHVRPAAKPSSSFETSSWGRIKETFAD